MLFSFYQTMEENKPTQTQHTPFITLESSSLLDECLTMFSSVPIFGLLLSFYGTSSNIVLI